jgi:hypothetical protein
MLMICGAGVLVGVALYRATEIKFVRVFSVLILGICLVSAVVAIVSQP